MAKDQGGSAFPSTEFAAPGFTYQDGATHRTEEGMSLRDWFAGKALPGLIALAAIEPRSPFDLARHAYAIADAMIAESRK